jgi:hypothetical protein
MYADMSLMEHEVRKSNLDWIKVRPSGLTNVPVQHKYLLSINRIPKG